MSNNSENKPKHNITASVLTIVPILLTLLPYAFPDLKEEYGKPGAQIAVAIFCIYLIYLSRHRFVTPIGKLLNKMSRKGHHDRFERIAKDDLLVAIEYIKEYAYLAIFILSGFLGCWFMITNAHFFESKHWQVNSLASALFIGPMAISEIFYLYTRDCNREILKKREKNLTPNKVQKQETET